MNGCNEKKITEGYDNSVVGMNFYENFEYFTRYFALEAIVCLLTE